MPRERQEVRERGGDEPLRGGARHRGGHIRHAVVDDTFFDEVGGGVCRRAGRFDRPPLVDSDIHHHRPGPHRADHRPGNQERRPLSRHQHGGNDEVGLPDRIAHRLWRRPDRAHLSPAFTVCKCQFFRVHVEDRHVRADPGGDPRGVAAGHTCSQHGHIPRRRSFGTGEQDTAPPAPLFEPPRPNLDGEDPRHLAHRPKDRQRAGGRHGLVSDGRNATGQKLFREPRQRGKVQEGEKGGRFRQERKLAGQRLLDLHHEVGGPRLRRLRGDRGAGIEVFPVLEPAGRPGAGLHDDLCAGLAKGADRQRRNGDPVLPGLGLSRDTDAHRA